MSLVEVVLRNRKDAQAGVVWGGKSEVAVSVEQLHCDVEPVAAEKKVDSHLGQAELGK